MDFTQPDTGYAHCVALLDAGVHGVVGTTGFTEEQIADLDRRARSGAANLLIAPNFSTGSPSPTTSRSSASGTVRSW